MNNQLQVLTIQGVRGFLDAAGTAWLNSEDVARGLGFVDYQEKSSATSGRKTYEVIRWARVNGYLQSFGYPTEVNKDDFIPENMFYRLAMKASNAVAEVFQAKVADVILPSIRKQGIYVNPDAPLSAEFLYKLAGQVASLEKERDEYKTLAARREKTIEELKPEAEYCRLILQSTEALPTRLIAKDYGYSASAFNQKLHELRIIYKCGQTWVLYQMYAGLGYTVTRTKHLSDNFTVTYTCWTQKGRMFLYNILKKNGIVPLCESESNMATLL